MTFTAGQRLTASALNTAFANCPQLITSTILTVSAASISITIPAGYNHLQGVFTGRQDSGSGGAFCNLRLNADSGSNYLWEVNYGSTSSTTAASSGGLVTFMHVGVLPGSGDTGSYFGSGSFEIGNVASTVAFKTMSSQFQGPTNTTASYSGTAGGLWQSTAVVTSVALLPNTGNLLAGSSMSIYGWS